MTGIMNRGGTTEIMVIISRGGITATMVIMGLGNTKNTMSGITSRGITGTIRFPVSYPKGLTQSQSEDTPACG
jgi:hypothetical protein